METAGLGNKIRIEISDQRRELEHFQQETELLYVMQGSLNLTVESENVLLSDEDIFVINANRKHGIRAEGNVFYAHININYDMLIDMLGTANVIFLCDSTRGQNEAFDELRDIIRQLLKHYVNNEGSETDFGHIALCYRLLDNLSVNFMVRNTDYSGKTDDAVNMRIGQINSYIQSNYKAQVSLKDMADRLYLSEAYLSRFFKKYYGTSFVKYVNDLRMKHAMEELLNTSDPITRIAYNNGFSNAAVFNKNFRQAYGETPSQYRKKQQTKIMEERPENSEELKERLVEYVREETRLGLKRSDTDSVVDAECEIGPVEGMKLTNTEILSILDGGSAEEMRDSDMREHLTMLAQMFHYKYVRFWNLLSEDMLLCQEIDTANMNFSRLDALMDMILDLGLKPIIDLGAKPKNIMKNVQDYIYREDTVSQLNFDLSRWEQLIDQVFKHFCDNYGTDVVSSWIVELWRDEREDMIADYDYFSLFDMTVRTIRRRVKNIRFAGCGLRGDKDRAELTAFLKKWRKREYRPDYISVMSYPYESGEEKGDFYSKRSTDDDFIIHQVRKIKECMKNAGFSESTKLLISEWNCTLSDRNIINDTCYKGAFVVKNMLQVMDDVKAAGYFRPSDRAGEYFDTDSLLFGGMGLITKDTILKPAGFAFEFFQRLLPRVVKKTDDYIITTDGNGNFCIVCHNQKKLSYSYYLTTEGEARKEDVWKYYESREQREFRFCLKGVPEGKYKIKSRRVNEENGSILTIWKDLNFEKSISREDIRYFRKVCEPRLYISTVQTEKKNLAFSMKMMPNEIACIRVFRDE